MIKSYLEASDNDILSMVDYPDYPSSEDISTTSQIIRQAIQEDKRKRLEKKKAEFASYKIRQETTDETFSHRSVSTMISDIVATMQNTDVIPKGNF